MDYFAIIKKSYHIALKQKFLWVFVIITSLSYVFFRIGTFASEYSFESLSSSELLLIGLVSFIFSLIFFVLNLTGQGALIIGFDRINSNEKTTFKYAFEQGLHRFFRIFGLMFLIWLGVMVSLIILILPVVLFVISEMYLMAIIIGAILFIVCLIFWLVLAFIYPYALRMVVLEKISVFSSLRSALHLVRENFLDVIVMYLIAYAISIGYMLVLFVIFALAALLLFAVGYGIWLASPILATIYAYLAIILIATCFIVINSAYTTFNSGIFTLIYLKLKNK